MLKTNWKEFLLKSLKIAVAAILAIAVAGEFGLKYSATAGIITVLSIQNTKRETFQSAKNRGLAFLCALFLAGACYFLCGYTLTAFALYLFFFALLCLWAGWGEALAMDSVLISHFLTEQNMSKELLINEIFLFCIGTGCGILANLLLHKKGEEFERLAEKVDEEIKNILHDMWLCLTSKAGTWQERQCFDPLWTAIEAAERCAAANYNNTLLREDTFESDYIRMRRQQSLVLQSIHQNICSISYLPKQAESVAGLIERIEKEFHKYNTVEGLLRDLEELLSEMKRQELPASREEFEARAILFYVLMQLKSLLQLKREFVLKREE